MSLYYYSGKSNNLYGYASNTTTDAWVTSYVTYSNVGTTAVTSFAWDTSPTDGLEWVSNGIGMLYGGGTIQYGGAQTYVYSTPFNETEEQKAARLELERKQAEEARAADRKARRLFVRVAGLVMYKQLKRKGYVDAIGQSGARYRLAVGQMVRVMEGNFGDKVLHKLCAYIPGVPQVDTLVAQYLALVSGVSEEEEFKKVAIKHAA